MQIRYLPPTGNKELDEWAARLVEQLGTIWVAGIAVGTFTRDTAIATGTQVISGVGFQPNALILLANVVGTSETSIGFGGSSADFCISNYYAQTAGKWATSTIAVLLYQAPGPIYYTGTTSSFQDDGFTITWTKTGAKTGTATIQWFALR